MITMGPLDHGPVDIPLDHLAFCKTFVLKSLKYILQSAWEGTLDRKFMY